MVKKMEKQKVSEFDFISWLRGGQIDLDVTRVTMEQPELAARTIYYLLTKGGYHRERLIKALVKLINYAPPEYRKIAWVLFQKVPLSHLLYVTRVFDKNRENSRRLRHAIVNNIAISEFDDVFRAFFMGPELFRRLFSYLKLPRTKIKDREIRNPAYCLAYQLTQLSVPEAMKKYSITPFTLIRDLKIPFHMVMQYVDSPLMAMNLAHRLSADEFFRHGRWFRQILGDQKYTEIVQEKIKYVRDPVSFLAIKEHLEKTGALTPQMTKLMEKRAEEALNQILQKYKLERLALIVDVSGSMNIAKKITAKLYEAFSRMTKITHLIAFNQVAFTVSLERLRQLECDGYTSIGSAIVLLASRLRVIDPSENPEAIILVSDLGENTPPPLNESLRLLKQFGEPPLIVIHCGEKYRYRIEDYPHAIIPVDDFHPRLVADIVKEVARLTAKVAKEEREVTRLVKSRRPLSEELGELKLPTRPEYTLKPGYLEALLCED